ncbi:RTA1-domain-containing protein [Aspergillus carlsbadensis]|nr:RTA1-domain-containing protein [Aspergillus carlsbadensis]
MSQLVPLKSGYYVWKYVPSIVAAVIFLILFSNVTVYHFWKMWRSRIRFTLPFAIGGIFEIIGYGARIGSHNDTGKLMPYCIQAVFILLGPALFAASVYMILGRIIRSVRGENHSPLRIPWLTKTFVLCDILTFIIQAGGSGMMVNSDLTNTGEAIVIAGLAIQVVSFCLFLVTAIIFHARMRSDPDPSPASRDPSHPWRQHLGSLYAISGLILVRSIFRVVEYVMGNDGYPLTHEWTLYIFDAVPMFAAMVVFAVWYPSDLKPFIRALDYPADEAGEAGLSAQKV